MEEMVEGEVEGGGGEVLTSAHYQPDRAPSILLSLRYAQKADEMVTGGGVAEQDQTTGTRKQRALDEPTSLAVCL